MCGMSKVAKFAEKTLGALEVESTDTRSRTQIRMTIASTRNLCILGDSATHMDTPLNNNKHAVYRYVPAILSATRYKKNPTKFHNFPGVFSLGGSVEFPGAKQKNQLLSAIVCLAIHFPAVVPENLGK